MNDLEQQFFSNDNLESQFFAEQPKEETKRGANLAGAIRNIAQATPFIGTYSDEAEGLARSLLQGGDYETWRRNAEESALGNVENTGYGRGLEIGTNLLENALLGYLSGGATLTPNVSAVQGGVEGFGRGEDVGERTANALAGGTIGYFVPSVLNRVFPTKTIQKKMLSDLSKKTLETTAFDPKVSQTIIAKALQQGTTPEQIIINEVSKGYRDNLLKNIARSGVGENVYRGALMKNMAEIRRPGYAEYVGKEIENVLPGWGNKFTKEVENIESKALGEDIFEKVDPRKIVKTAVNNIMKGAKQEEKELASNVMENAIATQGVAKKTLPMLSSRPIPTSSGSIWSFARRAQAPFRNLGNYGTMRALTVGTPNFVPSNSLEKLLNFYTPNWLRGAVDPIVEEYEIETLK